MKRILIVCLVLSLLALAGFAMAQQTAAPAAPAPAPAAAAPAAASAAAPSKAAPTGFTIVRMEIASGVEKRQPTGIAAEFPATTEKVFCYLELTNVIANSPIVYVWTLGLNEMARVTQTPTRTVAKYRTFSTKAIGGLKGDWKVDIQDGSGNVIKTASFKVM